MICVNSTIKSGSKRKDRCGLLPVVELNNPAVKNFYLYNVDETRYYLIDRIECNELYKQGILQPFLQEGKWFISEPGNPKIPNSGYGAHFRCHARYTG